MTAARLHVRSVVVLAALAAVACGDGGEKGNGPGPAPIERNEGTAIGTTEWRWIPFPDTLCTNADYTTSTTGLAISWTPSASTDLVVFLAGGGACWDYLTCYAGAAATGPFGPAEFEANIFNAYPNSWVHRANLPAALADATIVFVPYCTGDVHTGDKVTTYTYAQGFPTITWHHVGRRNLAAFVKRLEETFPAPGKLVVAGSSAGGFGSLANYALFKAAWPSAKSYLIDDSGPPLIGNAIPESSRAAWYQNWNMGGATLDAFCPECRTDMSAGMKNLKQLYPNDRIALVSHNEDLTIRQFFGTFTATPPFVTPMDAPTFEAHLKLLGTTVIDPSPPAGNARYFFSNREFSDDHPMLLDPSVIDTPTPGLTGWIQLMISDDAGWASAMDP